MADKILDVRHVMDEMVSPEGLQAGGGGGVTVDDFVAGAGIEIMPDLLTESKIQISVDPAIIEVGDTFYANIDIPDDSHGNHSDLLLTTDRPSLAYLGTVGADEAIFYDDNGNTFTPSELRSYMMTHAMKSIQITIRDYNFKKLVIEAKYNSNSGRMFNGTELGTGSDLVISDQTITIAGATYKAMPIYYASFTYDQINQTVDWDVHGQLEAADSLIGSVIGTQSISTGETITGAINTLIDDTIPVPTYASRTQVLADSVSGSKTIIIIILLFAMEDTSLTQLSKESNESLSVISKTITIAEDGWYRIVSQSPSGETTQIQTLDGSALCGTTDNSVQSDVVIPIKAGTQLLSLVQGTDSVNYIFKIN